jgi:LPS export ABC transporter protein LptC
MMPKKHLFLALLCFALMALNACNSNMEVINTLGNPEKTPDVTQINVEILYSDSAKVRAKITARESNIFANVKEPYIEFPKGMHIYFYDDSLHVTNELSAKYAIYYSNKHIYEARNDVVVINRKGDKLNTEQLFWDGNRHVIYTHKYCRVTDSDGYQHVGNNGLESDEKFENYQFNNVRGTMQVNTNEP